MIKPYHHFYWTNSTKSLHLGDLVNIYQQAANEQGLGTLFSTTVCPCCGNNAKDVLKFLTELNHRVKFGRLSGKPKEMLPWWFKGHDGVTCAYVKALKLPKKRNHIAYQIDSRSRGKKIPGWIGRAIKLIKNGINVGDRPMKGKNAIKVSLEEKFEIIASARYYVGIDSGLTHLALMTDTPILLAHPSSWDVKRFYPLTSQIITASTYEGFVKSYETGGSI